MKVQGTHYRSIWYDHKDCQVKIIDQRWLPHDFRIVALTNLDQFAVAIRDMWVRGKGRTSHRRYCCLWCSNIFK